MGNDSLEQLRSTALDMRGQVEALEFTCVTIIGLLDEGPRGKIIAELFKQPGHFGFETLQVTESFEVTLRRIVDEF